MNEGIQQGVRGREHTVRQLFSEQYLLAYYQREYTWERRHVVELVSDLANAFLRDWQPEHDRQRYAAYRPYFLGPFVCHPDQLKKSLVDGQQRFTTLHLLLIHIEQLLKEQGEEDTAIMVGQMVRRYAGGQHHYTIDVEERRPCLEALRSSAGFDSSGTTVSVQNLWERAQDIAEALPEALRDECLPIFADWLADRVYLVEISADDRDLSWEIFETMNDRGAGLTSLDLLKSFVLSRAGREQGDLNDAWRKMLADLSEFGRQVPSNFFETLLLARYAAPDGSDNAEIERAFHEWVRLQPERVGLRLQGKDYSDFVLETVAPAAEQYRDLLKAARTRTDGVHAVFYNSVNGIDSQYLLIMAALRHDDSPQMAQQKAQLLASYLDLLFTLRIVNNDTAIQDQDFREEVQRLLPAIRGTSTIDDLRKLLGREAADIPYDFSGIEKLSLHNNRRHIRYLLTRITAFVENGSGRPDQADRYLGRGPGFLDGTSDPWEVEHIWANKFSLHVQTGVANEQDFQRERNRLGALLLLEKSINASFGADIYRDKLPHYAAQNFLAASLHPNAYKRNPTFRKFREKWQLEGLFIAYPYGFDTKAITARSALYRRLCELIWRADQLGFTQVTTSVPHQRTTAGQKKPRYGVQVADLMRVGLVQEGTELRAELKRSQRVFHATITASGRIRLEPSGEEFGSLSGAGTAATGGPSNPGWTFWFIKQPDGSAGMPMAAIRKQAIEQGLLDQTPPSA
ncbi:GmrSD restriction endonuclease domain-containing protein [Streptomyces sp. bgisy031]|uniref:GmrSD restriction endonuclease domain-containing protein n=1 Tax=Streptomyces sp. bgisy031 TaxID=3413772 RepID=UPI003D70342A